MVRPWRVAHHSTENPCAGNNIGAEGAKALAENLSSVTQLHTLHLTGNQVCAEGAQCLAEHFAQVPLLQRLELRCTRPPCAYSSIANSRVLTVNNIGSAGARAIADHLHQVPRLTTLNLADNRIRSDGVRYIMKRIPASPQLTNFSIDEPMTMMSGPSPA